jgi:hypothetical protein
LARRVLSTNLPASASAGLGPWLLLALSLSSCRREEHAPAPSASASAAADNFREQAREQHLGQELTRARARWQAQPSLGDCAAALKEKADLELCQAAASALAALVEEPAAAPEPALTRLASAALALTRLAQRARYLSLAELARRRVQGDAGVAPAPSASTATRARAMGSHLREKLGSAHGEQRTLELGDGPVAQLLATTTRLERDAVRHLGAYLEYGPLPVRRLAFDTVKRLHAEHPQWPMLEHLLRDASVLEPDQDLQRQLRDLAASALPQRDLPAHSAGTK